MDRIFGETTRFNFFPNNDKAGASWQLRVDTEAWWHSVLKVLVMDTKVRVALSGDGDAIDERFRVLETVHTSAKAIRRAIEVHDSTCEEFVERVAAKHKTMLTKVTP